jgi:hypothetical protein
MLKSQTYNETERKCRSILAEKQMSCGFIFGNKPFVYLLKQRKLMINDL